MRPRGNRFIQSIQLYDKYARWRSEDQRRETWPEVVARVLDFLQRQPRAGGLTPTVWAQLRTALLAQDVLPSMRVVQMDPGPMPTLTPSAPWSTNALAAEAVAILPPMICSLG